MIKVTSKFTVTLRSLSCTGSDEVYNRVLQELVSRHLYRTERENTCYFQC